MGNHYHLVAKFDDPREMTAAELRKRALIMYPKNAKVIAKWDELQLAKFQKRIFNVSEFMRNLQGAYARWYNRRHVRKGRFWAQRYKSTLLTSHRAARECVLYVELNAVRAGLVKRPDDYRTGSAFLRSTKNDGWLLPLSALFEGRNVLANYRSILYLRGEIPTKRGQAKISRKVIEREEARGFAVSGIYSKRLRYWTDGLAVGADDTITNILTHLRKKEFFLRRKNPRPIENSPLTALREQRSHGD